MQREGREIRQARGEFGCQRLSRHPHLTPEQEEGGLSRRGRKRPTFLSRSHAVNRPLHKIKTHLLSRQRHELNAFIIYPTPAARETHVMIVRTSARLNAAPVLEAQCRLHPPVQQPPQQPPPWRKTGLSHPRHRTAQRARRVGLGRT